MSFFGTYLIVMADNIHLFFAWALGLSIVTILLWALVVPGVMAGDYYSKRTFPEACAKVHSLGALKVFLPLIIFFMIGTAAMPNTKQLAVIYLIPTVTQNEQVQGISNKTLKLMEGYLEKWLIELDDSVAKKGKEVTEKLIDKGVEKVLE